jgi:hypothetical protein
MTDHDLATLVHTHVRQEEPPFLLSADTAIGLGRRTLRRRRMRRGLTGVVAAAAAIAIAVPLLDSSGPSGDDRTGIDPATAAALAHYDAGAMPVLIDQHARAALGDGLEGLGQAEFGAFDDQGAKLPERYYDKASGMSVRYGDGDRRVEVSLLHSRSEAEGNARKNCANDLAGGIYFSCTVSTSAAGDTVTTTVMAVTPSSTTDGWNLVTRAELDSGVAAATNPDGAGPIDPGEVYFVRRVESVHSATFLTGAEETVRAPDLAAATRRWRVPAADLAAVATDRELVIPKPPMGDNGCAWMLHPEGVTCGKAP